MHECAINNNRISNNEISSQTTPIPTTKIATPKPLKIFISGPYTDNLDAIQGRNTQRVIDIGIELYQRGHFPYIPHLTHWVDKQARELGVGLKWEDYMNWHLPWLELCDALYFVGMSKGANLELATAVNMGKVIFRRMDEVPVLPVQYRLLGV